MAIIEVQFREDVFFDVIKAEIVRTQVPSSVIDEIANIGKVFLGEEFLIEQIECIDVNFATSAPGMDSVPVGELLLLINLTIHLTTFTNARSAGHLAAPAATPYPVKIWMRLSVTPQKVLNYQVVASDPNGFATSGSLSLATDLLSNISVRARAILANDGAVIIRFGNRSMDEEKILVGGINRLGASQWGIFIDGELFAQELAKQLNDAVDPVVTASQSPKLEIKQRADGAWFLPQRFAAASVELNAIDALPLGFDVPFRIEAKTEIQPYLDTALNLTTRIQWIAEDVLTDIGLGFAQDQINDAIANNLRRAPDDQKEIARGDNFIEYRTIRYLDAPHSRTFSGKIVDIQLDDSGLAIMGLLQVRPMPSAAWSLTPPSWTLSGNCNSRSCKQQLNSPEVHLVGSDPYVELRQLRPAKVDPERFWVSDEHRSRYGAVPVALNIELKPSPSLLGEVRTGVTLSAYLYTNLGVRWVNFGIVPPKPVVSERKIMACTIELISQCMAISDLWGMGIMNPDWLVDPPDWMIDFGFPPLQEWFISGKEINEVNDVELFVIGPDGNRQLLGSASIVAGMLLHRVVTDANETIELRTGVPMAGPAPQIMHRWIAPWLAVPTDGTVNSFVLNEGILRTLHDDGSFRDFQIVDHSAEIIRHSGTAKELGCPIKMDDEIKASINIDLRNPYMLGNRQKQSSESALHALENLSSVAVLHHDKIILGIAGRFEPVVGKARRSTKYTDICP